MKARNLQAFGKDLHKVCRGRTTHKFSPDYSVYPSIVTMIDFVIYL